MAFVRVLHVLSLFMWLGNLLALTRLMGYHPQEDDHVQLRMARIYKRMHNFISVPTMMTTILFGGVLIFQADFTSGIGWFVSKMVFAAGLVVCNFVCGFFVEELSETPYQGRGVKFKILHGVTGLLLIGALTSIYLVKS